MGGKIKGQRGATVYNQGSRMRETNIGVAKRSGKASERASERKRKREKDIEIERERKRERAREETMNGGVICNGISWQQWRIVWQNGRIVVC